MRVRESSLPGVLLVEPAVFEDERGFFFESYNAKQYADAGIAEPFPQDNVSFSMRSVLRGLHLQNPNSQGKLVQVQHGEVFDVAVDLRIGSPNFARWNGTILSAANRLQIYIPAGFAHGFCVTSETALFVYKCTALYDAKSELSIAWNDPQLGIDWPLETPSLSANDAAAPRLAEMDQMTLPAFPDGEG